MADLPEKRDELQVIMEMMQEEDDFTAYRKQLPVEVRSRIDAQQRRIKHGLNSASLLVCPGYGECIFQKQCSIPKRYPDGRVDPGKPEHYPVGGPCVVEKGYYETRYTGYFTDPLLRLDPSSAIERGVAQDLANLDVLKRRAELVLGGGDRMKQGQDFLFIGEILSDREGDMQGEVISHAVTLHPAADIMLRIDNQKMKHMKQLNATREAQINTKIKMGEQQNKRSGNQEIIQIVAQTIKQLQKDTSHVIDLDAEMADLLTLK